MNTKIITEIKSLINPNRIGGVSRFELEKAMGLLSQLETPRENALTPSQKEEVESMIESAIIKATS